MTTSGQFKYLLILSLAVALSLPACGTKEAVQKEAYIVLFAGGGSQVERGGQKVDLRVGDRLEAPEIIHTTNGTVDLQSRAGAVVRVRKYTVVRLGALGSTAGKGLHLRNGSVLAKLKRRSQADEFAITTPTSIASVRGTTFSVSVEDGRQPTVRVLDGSVAVAPQAEIKTGEQTALIKGKEVVVEQGSVASLPIPLEQELLRTAALLSQAVVPEDQDQLRKQLEAAVQSVAVNQKATAADPREVAEADTLVQVEMATINEVLDRGEAVAREKLKKEYEKRLDQALVVVEKKMQTKTFKDRKELLQYYKVLEVVVTKDGKSRSGAVVAQAGDTLILHTTKGSARLKTGQVDYIEYVQK